MERSQRLEFQRRTQRLGTRIIAEPVAEVIRLDGEQNLSRRNHPAPVVRSYYAVSLAELVDSFSLLSDSAERQHSDSLQSKLDAHTRY